MEETRRSHRDVVVHPQSSRILMSILIDLTMGEKTQQDNGQPVGPSHAQSSCSAAGQP